MENHCQSLVKMRSLALLNLGCIQQVPVQMAGVTELGAWASAPEVSLTSRVTGGRHLVSQGLCTRVFHRGFSHCTVPFLSRILEDHVGLHFRTVNSS